MKVSTPARQVAASVSKKKRGGQPGFQALRNELTGIKKPKMRAR